ncbi:unnamed protein product [Diatraea saccharalis]|uniref:Uncharacterized protein n=1 Tax=Diatraea saccharalis TaxID=40085 RepID=A0A9N9R017_9NEOP|nr:unnamed protein product [Diatraea saccharalis]
MLRTTDDCWITLDAKKHFEDMEELESTYKSEAELCSEKTADKTAKFDEETIERMLSSRARLEGKGSVYEEIPAGLNLGGYSIIRMPKSLLILLKNVKYSVEGRLRYLYDSPYIVLMVSSLSFERALLMEIALKQGRLRGLDSIYRRSVATGTHVGKIRTVDAVVGFSNLKITVTIQNLILIKITTYLNIVDFNEHLKKLVKLFLSIIWLSYTGR